MNRSLSDRQRDKSKQMTHMDFKGIIQLNVDILMHVFDYEKSDICIFINH